MAVMVSVSAARQRAQRVVEREQRAWAAHGGAEARLDIPLHPPGERQVLDDVSGARAWQEEWRRIDNDTGRDDIAITWAQRRWASIGSQSVPERIVLAGADAIAHFAGAASERMWNRMRARTDQIRKRFAQPHDPEAFSLAIRTTARTVSELAEGDLNTLLEVVDWLAQNPTSGWRIRQLPIRGVDTKWLERHRGLVDPLHRAITGLDSLGLVGKPDLVRVRFLDPDLRPGGICDVSAPIEEMAALPIQPRTVFVCENLETVLAMPALPGAVVMFGSGFAVSRLGEIPWVRSGRVIYWGDLDSDGFAILNAIRAGCDNVTSILMDVNTLLAHRDLWVEEKRPARGVYPHLTPDELDTLERIRSEGNVRLEQERIPWPKAIEALTSATAGR